MKKFVFVLLLFFVQVNISAQTEIRSMFYNLLNFPSDNPGNRADTLKKILDFYPVDLLMVCELKSEEGAQKILDEVLNVNGITSFERAVYVPQISNPYSDWRLQQTIFYNSDKIHLTGQTELITSRRDINVFETWVVNPLTSETTYLDIYVTHFKSSQGASNEALRLDAAEVFTNYLDGRPAGANVIFAGDLNLYTSFEDAYQQLLDSENQTLLLDPINAEGDWHTNDSYDYLHTQSTRTNQLFGDGAGGGLDDRFDFILTSKSIIDGEKGLIFVPGSYEALGNTRECYNASILLCDDNTIPTEVNTALYHMSDHLPVVLTMESAPFVTGISDDLESAIDLKVWSAKSSLDLLLNSPRPDFWSIKIIDLMGRIQDEFDLETTEQSQRFQRDIDLQGGHYVLIAQSRDKGHTISLPFIVFY